MSDAECRPSSPRGSNEETNEPVQQSETTADREDGRKERSISPIDKNREQKPRRKDAGFKWKEKRRDENEDFQRDRDHGLKRGYRDHYKPRERERSRSRSPRRREFDRHDGRQNRSRDEDRDDYNPRRGDRDRDRDRNRDQDREREEKHRSRHRRDDRDGNRDRNRDRPAKKDKLLSQDKKISTPTIPSQPQQEMILVTVNDRLGTKRQVPCLPSDTIKDFKAVVAMMIGRRPHEILLKRQSERPFKDFLTLQDYGISNNVQLDLEVDTGD